MNPLILVCDDTEGTRYSVCRVLRADGFRVIEAANGTDALKLADEQLPDLSILDIHLPDMLGFEVCRRMKAKPKLAAMPILQISASYVSSKDKINGLEGGADSYLTHPVEPAVLVATVRALLRLRDLNRKVQTTDERLELALRAAPITLFEIDHELKFVWAHLPAGRNGPTDLIGRRIDEVYPTDEARSLVKLQQHVFSTGESAHTLFHNTFEGVHKIYDMRLAIKLDEGQPIGVVTAATDVTERELAKVETERARDAAEAANRTKSQFIANVSHEIRTPLGVIMGFSDLILDGMPDREENMKSVAVIKRNAVQLARLIDEVLDLSKVEADRMEIETIRFDLCDIVEDVKSVLNLRAREKSIALDFHFDPSTPALIKSDPLRLRQILLNLVGNAIKFTDRGAVKLEIAPAFKPVSGQPVDLKFRISDTGIGITKEQSTKLFEAFMQADPSTTRRFGGTGLGLMLSKKLAHALGGELILAESEPGAGSVFELTITDEAFSGPLFSQRQSTAQTKTAAANGPQEQKLGGISVLLVEDSPDNQIMIQRFLSQAGARVDLASDGQSGVERASQGQYDVVLMDIQMPKMDGYQATTALRANGFKSPIVALTAHALKGEREKCIAVGCSDYLTKPVNRQGLIDKVHELASLKRGDSFTK